MKKVLSLALILCAMMPGLLRATTTIDPTNKFAWAANVGFTNWRPSDADGVAIGDNFCSGYIYAANAGWINMGSGSPANGIQYSNTSATDFGVNCTAGAAGEKNLRGFAYGANIGWVNFEATGNPRVILSTGQLRGFVYSANCGWINLDDATVFVQTAAATPTPTPTPTATATATATPTATATATPTATATATPTAMATATPTATATATPTATATATPTATATATPTATATATPTVTATATPTATATATSTATATATATPTATAIATAAPTPTPTVTPTPTPTPTPITISGTISYCSNPVPGPVPNVTLTLTGNATASTMTDGSGNYQFSSLASGGSYIVTPTEAAHLPGSPGINTVDVIATQRHFLNLGTPLTGCKLMAADVNGSGTVNTIDVIAIQRFFLGLTTGIANTGKYQFTPASRLYPGVVSDQTAQNYDTLIFGDVTSPFADRLEGPSQTAAGDGTSAGEVPATVAAVELPEVAVDVFVTNFIVQVTTTTIDAGDNLVGFQGDFTFDERVVTFQSQPVQKAGLTGDNWNVSGNVLAGAGPIRTLRISAYSNDFTPLSGSGTLFELRMTRVSKAAQGTQLIWAAPPDEFIFIDADLNTQKPDTAASGSVTPSGKRK